MATTKSNRTRRACMLCGQPVITTTEITRTGQTVYRFTEHVDTSDDAASRCRYQGVSGSQSTFDAPASYPGDMDCRVPAAGSR